MCETQCIALFCAVKVRKKSDKEGIESKYMHQESPKAVLRIPLELRSVEVTRNVPSLLEMFDLAVSDRSGLLSVSSIRVLK